MSDNDIKRVSRLTAIISQLQVKRLVTAPQLAAKFGVSLRTIYRDIKALQDSGIPVLMIDGKGYSLMDGYRLPPVMFTQAEANALITAEQLAANNADQSFADALQSAVNKIKVVLRSSTKAKTELLSDRIAISPMMKRADTSHSLSTIQQALTEFRVLNIRYRSLGTEKETARQVEPFALYYCQDESWALIAWCRLRKDFRMFRLDRIVHAAPTPLEFLPHRITLKEYLREKRTNFSDP